MIFLDCFDLEELCDSDSDEGCFCIFDLSALLEDAQDIIEERLIIEGGGDYE